MNPDYLINKTIQIIFYPKFTGILFWIRFIFLAVSAFFFSFILWSILKLSWFVDFVWRWVKEFLSFKPLEKKEWQKKWEKIKSGLQSDLEAEAKLAILEAESLLHEVLKWEGYKGENLEEMIIKASSEHPLKVEEILFLSRLKENIVNDPNLKLSFEERKRILSVLQETLSLLDIIK